jgi:arylsulfatase A-like enzyme
MRLLQLFVLVLLVAQLTKAEGSQGSAPKPVRKPASHSASSPKPLRNVILITLDTTRADRMGFLGSQRGLTPHLDLLAKEGVVFKRAFSNVPLTPPSHATILTGTYPQYNHVDDFGSRLVPDIPYLPELLHKHGYHTAAFVSSVILDPIEGSAPGFERGFDVYDAGFHRRRPGEDRYRSIERRAEEVVAHAEKWLAGRRYGRPRRIFRGSWGDGAWSFSLRFYNSRAPRHQVTRSPSCW